MVTPHPQSIAEIDTPMLTCFIPRAHLDFLYTYTHTQFMTLCLQNGGFGLPRLVDLIKNRTYVLTS